MAEPPPAACACEGYEPPPNESTWAFYNKVGPDYFATLRIALVAGRDLARADDQGAPRVAVVNETMARRYWPGREALGGRVRLDEEWYTVVGVARDIRYRRLDEPAQPVLYLPLLQSWSDAFTLHVRATSDPVALAPAVRRELARLDAGVPFHAVRTLEESIKAATVGQRLAGTLLVDLRRRRPAARGRGPLRRAAERRGRAHARDRNPHGPGRRAE